MERRVYFILGDLLACITAGAAGSCLTQLAVSAEWFVPAGMEIGMALGMVLGMVLGMLVGMAGGFLFSPFFGSMEVMLPAILSGMLGGMGAGMLQAMAGSSLGDAVWNGASIGILCLAFTYILQARLHGEVR